ncbi:RhaT Permeases of the drug/metabolite transporter (DMT) superfamily [Candidatus Methylopumilus universalis]|uniref:DMT family transporter n=1 Tax=Candidatus Methylopumilus universalis TaxID=2588536 RepID=UPI003BEED113
MLLKKNQSLMAFFALMLLCLIWGYNWVVMKNALHFSDPFDFAALRTVLGAICLFIVMLVLKKPFSIKEIPSLIALGLLQTAGFTGLLLWALVEGGAGKTAVLTYTMPFWTMLLAWPLLGEKLRGWQWPAALFSLMGILFILDPLHLGTDVFSMILAIVSGISWALAVILAKKLQARSPNLDLISLTAWQMLFGSIPIVVLAFMTHTTSIEWNSYFIGALIYNAVFGNAIAWLLWLYALRHLSAGIATMTTTICPVIAVISSSIELHEVIKSFELLGMSFIGISLLMISCDRIKKHKEELVQPWLRKEPMIKSKSRKG